MAHDLHYDEGLGRHAAFFADKAAWHKLGVVVSGTKTWTEAIKLAGLDWKVEKKQLEYGGKLVPVWGIFRDDTMSFLGAVGKGYLPIQNDMAFDFVDTLLEAENGAHYESAGALGNGSKVWCLAKLPYDFKVGGNDPHQTYLMFTTSHDGSLSAQAKITTVRVVCNNTLQIAISGAGKMMKVKHTKESGRRLEAAKMIMSGVAQNVQSLEEKFNVLNQRVITKDSYMGTLNKLFPHEEGKSSTRRDNVLLEITRLFEVNDKDQFPEQRGTAFNLLNAITNYTDHLRGTRITEGRGDIDEATARTETAIFGNGSQLKETALEILLETTANDPTRPYKTYLTRSIEKGAADRTERVDSILDRPAPSVLDDILNNINNN